MILICATQRSGSTLLCEDLRNHKLGKAEEHFLPIVQGYTTSDPEGWISSKIHDASSENGVASIKTMSNYTAQVDRFLGGSGGIQDGRLWPAFFDRFHDAVWVRLHRRNIVRQAISRLFALKSGVNHSVATEAAAFKPGRSVIGDTTKLYDTIQYDADYIGQQIHSIASEMSLWDLFFETNGVEPVDVLYESMVFDLSYVHRVEDLIDQPRSQLVQTRQLRKLSNSRSEAVYRQYLSERVLGIDQAECNDDSHQTTKAQRPQHTEEPKRSLALGASKPTRWREAIATMLSEKIPAYDRMVYLHPGARKLFPDVIERAGSAIVVDGTNENFRKLKELSGGSGKLKFKVIEGSDMEGISNESVDFVFSLDALVRVNADDLRQYLKGIRRILRPNGHALLHHSNRSRNPEADFRRAPHARQFMSAELMRYLVHSESMRTVDQTIIDWGQGDRLIKNLDCLTLLIKDG